MRRYLRAFGPATAADVTAWSAVTRLGPVLKAMDDLVVHEDEDGKVLYDVPDGELADEDVPAPVRLLGSYDNVWLSHAGRDRVTDPERATSWMGVNGGVANTLFVDGRLAGLWRRDGRPGRGRLDAAPAHQARAGRARRGDRPGRGAAGPLTRLSPSGRCARAARRRRRRRRSRCAAPRRRAGPRARRLGEGRELLVGQAALGADHDDDRPRGRDGDRGQRLGRLLVQHHRERRPASSATTSAVEASVGHLGNQARRACLAASRAVARHWRATSPPARPSRPRPSGRPPTARSGPRRSR